LEPRGEQTISVIPIQSSWHLRPTSQLKKEHPGERPHEQEGKNPLTTPVPQPPPENGKEVRKCGPYHPDDGKLDGPEFGEIKGGEGSGQRSSKSLDTYQ
jgi:hypothetical protein